VGLSITQVAVSNFRSYESFLLKPDRSLTVLAGPNAAGKTNLIEAIQLLTAADSFRKPGWGETIKTGAPEAVLSLEAKGDNRKLEIGLTISSSGRRSYMVNGKSRRSVNQVAGVLPCVVFTPDDLRMVKDAAERRRSALDSLGSQLSPTYARLKSEYEKTLRHRNALLREGVTDTENLAPWSERLAVVGGSLVNHRMRLFDRMSRAMGLIYPRLTDDGLLEATYVPSWERDGFEADGISPEDAIRGHMEGKLTAELSRRSSVSGPHRDEIVFRINGSDARVYASQGQQRTIALAWKLAEVEVISDIAAQPPILLLDDVMSELDERRRHALTALVGSVTQTVMTTTNLGYFEEGLLERAKVVALP